MRPGLVALLLLAGGVAAQDLRAALEEKLKSPFVSRVAWVQDYTAALQAAKEKDRVVFAYFTRSFAP